ncbi:hypothetical protein [Nocardioides antri]|uniref:Lipoprotein n=1 Tax=Nocardioides antri TaxID=2607659 RepID=A0A5B1LRN5_9ACTN|nr:hypothetical protein [Nocardioides antri]KAA1423176.1 hypothetical protein F0U47_20240 [Nocardioides antri]
MRLAAACMVFLVVSTLAACGDDADQASRAGHSASPDAPERVEATPPDASGLLSLDAACSRIWDLFKRHGDTPVGKSWDALVIGARRVLTKSQPDVVEALEPEVDGFEEATIDDYDRSQVLRLIRRGDRLVNDFATACGTTIERSYEVVL